MTSPFDWFDEQELAYEENGDKQRLAMARHWLKSYLRYEANPRALVNQFKKGRDMAQALREPGWVFLYDVWIAMKYEDYDLPKALGQSIYCVHELRKPVLRSNPWRLAAYNTLLCCYISIDPFGYADAIQQSLLALAREIPPGPSEDRAEMMGHHRHFLMAVGKIKAAQHTALQTIAAFDDGTLVGDFALLSPYLDLCWIEFRQSNWRMVQAYGEQAEAAARIFVRTIEVERSSLAQALIWQAVVARKMANESKAKRLLRNATAVMRRVQQIPNQYWFDGLAFFHELSEDLGQALQVREDQLKALRNTGRLGDLCDVQIKRCELLARMGCLTRKALGLATAATKPLKNPRSYQKRLEQLEKQNRLR